MEAPEPPTAHPKKQNPADAGFCEPEWGGWSAPPGGSLGIVIRVNQVARDTQRGAILPSQSLATCCSSNSAAPTASLPPPCSTRSRDSTGCRRRWADCARRLRHRKVQRCTVGYRRGLAGRRGSGTTPHGSGPLSTPDDSAAGSEYQCTGGARLRDSCSASMAALA
jgi:hypothetical protein